MEDAERWNDNSGHRFGLDRKVQFRTDIGDVGTRALWENLPGIAAEHGERLHRAPMDIADVSEEFRQFFEQFAGPSSYGLPEDEDDILVIEEEVSYYMARLHRYVEEELTLMGVEGDDVNNRKRNESKCLKVSLRHLEAFNASLYFDVVQNPEQTCGSMDEVVLAKYIELVQKLRSFNPTEELSFCMPVGLEAPKVRLYDSPNTCTIRELGPLNVECLVCIQAMVIRCSEVSPEMQIARFKCSTRTTTGLIVSGSSSSKVSCPEMREVSVLQGEAIDPKKCTRCKGKDCFRLLHNSCEFSSKQLLRVTEIGSSVTQGETPQSIRVYIRDDLIDSTKPGDRITIVGVYKVDSVKTLPSARALNSALNPYINGLSLEMTNKGKIRLMVDEEKKLIHGAANNINCTSAFTPEMQTEMEALARDPNIYEKLTKSLAPSIINKDDIKKGLLCQLFGGSELDNKKLGHFRKEIHILLCGDPSTAKSQLLQYVHQLSSRGVCTSGKGSSSVGLTVSVGKDPETKDFILESGAVVLSDQGICCIDEFDKMDDTARGILHEVMEQQTVSVAKVGIVASLNARTAILASANPINSRYDRRRAVIENINLPPSLFSRFDLLYLVLDQPDKQQDFVLAKGVCSQFMTPEDEASTLQSIHQEEILDKKTMANYISYARAVSNPKITKEVKPFLVDQYIKLRNPSNDADASSPSATSRQLEGLIRLSQALAKMELSKEVKEKHVVEAVRLVNVATYRALLDPVSGRLDFNQFSSGKSSQRLIHIQKIQTFILQSLAEARQNSNSGLSYEDLFSRMAEYARKSQIYDIDRQDYQEALEQLEVHDRSVTRQRNYINLAT